MCLVVTYCNEEGCIGGCCCASPKWQCCRTISRQYGPQSTWYSLSTHQVLTKYSTGTDQVLTRYSPGSYRVLTRYTRRPLCTRCTTNHCAPPIKHCAPAALWCTSIVHHQKRIVHPVHNGVRPLCTANREHLAPGAQWHIDLDVWVPIWNLHPPGVLCNVGRWILPMGSHPTWPHIGV